MRILLANHNVEPLPDVVGPLEEQGHVVLESSNLVATAAALELKKPNLVVFQPLTNDLEGFEVQQVLQRKQEHGNPVLLLVVESPRHLVCLAGIPYRAVEDFLVRPLSAEELALRIDFAAHRTDRIEQIERLNRTLEKETITDFKTGLYNDRFFFQRLREETDRADRHAFALSLILFDFDNFKEINDQFDHIFGDFVLLAFARKLRSVVRQIDIAARLGGDEFALLLPNTDLEEATQLAHRLQELVSDYRFEKDGRSTHLSLSMGVDTLHAHGKSEAETFLRRADAALLEAKKRGKNRICLGPEVAAAVRTASA